VQPGEIYFERDFNQQGEKTTAVRIGQEQRQGRGGAGWFSYDVPVEPAHPMALIVTYHRDSRRPRSFEILVDGQRIAEQKFEPSIEDRFFEIEYPIPAQLVGDKDKVTVRFQGAGGNEIAPVFGVRVVRR
jgi:hypothetical protein